MFLPCCVRGTTPRNFTPRSKLSITRNGETLSLRVDEILEKKFDDVFQLDGKRYSYPLDKILREKDEISSQYVANGIISRISLLGRIGGNDRGISRIESSSPSSRSSFAARQPYPTSSIFRLREKKRKKGEREKNKKQNSGSRINESCPSSCPPSSRPIAQIDHQNKPCLPSPLLITYNSARMSIKFHETTLKHSRCGRHRSGSDTRPGRTPRVGRRRRTKKRKEERGGNKISSRTRCFVLGYIYIYIIV